VNRLTHRTLDPRSKIPEYTGIGVPAPAGGRTARLGALLAGALIGTKKGQRLMHGFEFYVDPFSLHRLASRVSKPCEECETHRGTSLINFDFIDPGSNDGERGLCLLALRRADVCNGGPTDADQERR